MSAARKVKAKANPNPCSAEECSNLEWWDGLCHGHYKRRQLGKPLAPPLREIGGTPWDSLERAILEFADAAAEAPEGDAVKAWQRIKWRLRRALDRYNERMRRRGLKKHGK